jgi:small ligand-binding sensory domain FIST
MHATFAAASGTGGDGAALVDSLTASALRRLGGDGPPDLAILFVTRDFPGGESAFGRRVLAATGARHLLGASASGVIGPEGEFEGGHAASVFLARLPRTTILPWTSDDVPEDGLPPLPGTPPSFGGPADGEPSFLVLADPYSTPMDEILEAFHVQWPGRPVMGGLASGGAGPGQHSLWLDDSVRDSGAVGLSLRGGVNVRPLVSQGCRPVGRRYVVTDVDGPRLRGLAGRRALDVLRDTVEGLSPEDRIIARTSLHIGRVAHEARADFHRGDFLIRNLVAVVPSEGSLVVGDHMRRGQTIQFQLRDAATAREDLEEMLDHALTGGAPAAALLFSCGGRGSHLFKESDHDLRLVESRFGPIPVSGFFCAGEVGPVGPRSFLHGFTSSMVLFSSPETPAP